MSTAYAILTPASVEPLTLVETKKHLRVDFPDDDTLIARLIISARRYGEAIMHRSLAQQTLQIIETIERPSGGELSGPINPGPNWYEYQEQLGANPFGAAMFYFDIPQPPCLAVTLIETRTTVWDSWIPFTGNVTLDAVPEPARLYFQVPVTANQWRFTVQVGYDNVTKYLPEDIKQALFTLISFWYDHREGDAIPEGIAMLFFAHRINWI